VYLFPKEKYGGGILICGNMFLRNALIEMASRVSKANKFPSFIESGTKDFFNITLIYFLECKFGVCHMCYIVTWLRDFVGKVHLSSLAHAHCKFSTL
jgi:hypothetical protein